ncbi:hypothetical protein SFR_2191 [Streptomyces sp. FR-008]|nr:hypothetical protein SFR_2191 [Streptomyces sp. FR-008]
MGVAPAGGRDGPVEEVREGGGPCAGHGPGRSGARGGPDGWGWAGHGGAALGGAAHGAGQGRPCPVPVRRRGRTVVQRWKSGARRYDSTACDGCPEIRQRPV